AALPAARSAPSRTVYSRAGGVERGRAKRPMPPTGVAAPAVSNRMREPLRAPTSAAPRPTSSSSAMIRCLVLSGLSAAATPDDVVPGVRVPVDAGGTVVLAGGRTGCTATGGTDTDPPGIDGIA